MSDARETHARESASLQTRVNALNATNSTLSIQLGEITSKTDRERRGLEERLGNVDREIESKLRGMMEKSHEEMRGKNAEIEELKSTVRKLDDEIDARDQDYHGKMKVDLYSLIR
jgi:peptidoglycan hydrolase CwlO-like protein